MQRGIAIDEACEIKPTWNAAVCKGDVGRMTVGAAGGGGGRGGRGAGAGPGGSGGAAVAGGPGAGRGWRRSSSLAPEVVA